MDYRDVQAQLDTEQNLDHLLRAYFVASPVGDVQQAKRQIMSRVTRPRSALPMSRRIAVLFAALVLMLGLTGGVAAVYNKIIVVEPSRNVPDLAAVIQRAHFPVWVSEVGQLTRIQEIDQGLRYQIDLEYTLDDGQTFNISQSMFDHQDVWDQMKLIARDVDMNGYTAVLYQTKLNFPDGRTEWGPPALHWHTDSTHLTLWLPPNSPITQDQLVSIARSIQKTTTSTTQ